ncbi:MAG: YqgE/AlgH family protein [Verrucomicrobiae bacterium]|jgi:putative transcriptional regulator|nr:YqgE/AlgH family protein [Verrucomicrobiae bacterium]
MTDEFKLKSLRGQLLLDSGKLRGSWFNRAVLLICQHDAEGAFGLVLNRPSPSTLGEAIVADLPESLSEESLFIGGPVQSTALSFLRSDAFLPDANVMPGLSLEHSLEDLLELGVSYSGTMRMRVFAGYSGWAPGQLEDEMERGAWLAHPAELDQVFTDDPESLWQEILKGKGWKYRLLADAPDDLSSN